MPYLPLTIVQTVQQHAMIRQQPHGDGAHWLLTITQDLDTYHPGHGWGDKSY